MRTWIGLLAGLSLVGVACGGGGDATAPTTTEPVVATTSTSVPPSVSATRFEQLVEPVNCALGAAVQASDDWNAARAAAADVVTAQQAFVKGLGEEDWPDDAQAAVDTLTDAVTRELAAWRNVAATKTEDEVRDAAALIDSTTSAAAAAVRAELGVEQPEAFCPGQGG